jgi:DNA adenine methylase
MGTSYHGGKMRIGKRIAKLIYEISIESENEEDFSIQGYCEPFCGMLGVYQHIPNLFRDHSPKLKYKAGDVNESVILMWQEAQKGWIPPTRASEHEYDVLKNADPSYLKGYIGHQYSFGGQFFGGYAPKYGKTASSAKASARITKIAKDLENVKFTSGNYKQFSKLKGYVIYCDPPYPSTISRYYQHRQGRRTLTFNEAEFWDWCRNMSEDNIVFVSGYRAPSDFDEIMSSTHKLSGISPGRNRKERVEKLFVM